MKTLLATLIILILFGGIAGEEQGLSGEHPAGGGHFFYTAKQPALPLTAVKQQSGKEPPVVRYMSTANFLRHWCGGAILPVFGRSAGASQTSAFTTYTPTLLALGCQLTV